MSYSPATVARRFSILDGVTIQGVLGDAANLLI